MEIKVEFEVYPDNESLIERFLSDYPNATYEVDETIIFKNDEWESIDDVDTFLCEEICHEYEAYCYISDGNVRKEYYYDEEDEWFEKNELKMNKERYNQIIDEVYKIYVMLPKELSDVISDNEKFNGRNFTQEEFINKCKTNPEFSEKWGLKIEERELSLEERRKLAKYDSEFVSPMTVESWDRNNIPTKLITLTYNNKTIESYE